MTSEPEDARDQDRGRLPWPRAVLLLGLASVAAWVVIWLVSRWLLG